MVAEEERSVKVKTNLEYKSDFGSAWHLAEKCF